MSLVQRGNTMMGILLLATSVFGCAIADGNESSESEDAESLVEAQAAVATPVQVEASCGGKTSVYCVTVHLKDGAKLKPFLASASPSGAGFSSCRGWANAFPEKTVKEFSTVDLSWDGYNIKNASVIVSGSFHDDGGMPAFPQKVKEGGWISTFGYECSSTGGANNMRTLWIRNSQSRAFVEAFDLTKFKDSTSAPEAIVGLDPTFNKSAAYKRGRNFVGLTNPYNGGYGTVIFVVAKEGSGIGLTSAEAIAILNNKGCDNSQIVQMDGSTVAQVSQKTNGTWTHLIQQSRQMPQVFGIFVP